MQQRQLRLGDILDDYCPRERRLTNHAVVAMIGPDVKQTRCTTCDAEHEYKHARVPRQRRKADTPPALYAQVAAAAPKRVTHEDRQSEEPDMGDLDDALDPALDGEEGVAPRDDESGPAVLEAHGDRFEPDHDDAAGFDDELEAGEPLPPIEDGPVHRPLIRATLPREGQPPAARPAPDFTIRQPGGRPPNRFRRPRGAQGGHSFGGRNGNVAGGPTRGGLTRPGNPNGRPARRHGPNKRSK